MPTITQNPARPFKNRNRVVMTRTQAPETVAEDGGYLGAEEAPDVDVDLDLDPIR